MKSAIAAVLLLCSAPMGIDEARHLLARATFGGSADEVRELAALPYEEGVDRLLAGVRNEAVTPPPEWNDLGDAPSDEKRKLRRQEGRDLKEWWFRELIDTPSPFTERLVLFWHNHFTSSLRKVKSARLLYEQNQLFRRHAAGNFGELLRAIPKDAAMAIYLDIANSRRESPNENFARELLELFTLGEGHYQERDIKECARAFTGWRMRPARDRALHFAPRAHDAGEKTFLGKTGAFGSSDVIDILLAQDRTSEFIVEKLWREFVSPAPDAAEVKRLAAIFRAEKYEMKPLLRALFLSPHFRDARTRGQLVKSPVDFLVGLCRTFEAPPKVAERLPELSRSLGQDLFDPPNVKGWPGGTSWIDSNTLLLREQFLARFLQGADSMGPRRAANSKLEDFVAEVRTFETARSLLLAYPPVAPPLEESTLAEQIRALLFDPAFQLK